jgi:uncharacterized membrane protein
MKLLREVSINMIIGLNVFILFFLFFEKQIEIPALLKVAGRMHPLLLHFPIVLLVLVFIFEFFKINFQIEPAATQKIMCFLLLAGALSSALTVVLGLFLSQEDGYSGDLLLWHKWTGVAVSFIAAFLLWAYFRGFEGKFLKTGMAFSLASLLVAGHLGSSLTHGEDFLLAPLHTGNNDTKRTNLKTALVYNDLVRPIIQEKCYSCHNPDKAKGQLVMTDTASIKKGGKNGQLFTGGKTGESLIIERLLLDINHKHRMPPKGKPQLTENELSLIKAWVASGASFSLLLKDFPSRNPIHALANSLYGGTTPETYDFSPAKEEDIKRLNNSYRLVAPLAFESPGLDVTFFSRSHFNKKSLEEIVPLAKQVIHLNMSNMAVTDGDLAVISSFTNLRQLNLNYTEITDAGLEKITGLKELQSLMLSGTRVTARGLARVANLPKLKNVYAWNTSILASDAKNIAHQFRVLHIDTGFIDDGKDTLTLNSPVFLPQNAFFRKPFLLDLKHPVSGTDIAYKVDGSTPDSLSKLLFKKPIPVNKNTLVKAKAIKPGWASSKIVEKYYQRSSIRPDTFSLKTLPDPFHKGRGVSTLFDLKEGSTDILYASDGNWLGYRNQDFVVEMGFQKPLLLKEIILSTLTSVALESFPPAEIEIWTSVNGADYALASKFKPAMPEEKSPVKRNMIDCPLMLAQPVKAIKIIAKPLKKLPKWHKSPDSPGWFFIDEILLN